jgi:hypothetical protein
MTPHEMEALTAADLAAELGWSPRLTSTRGYVLKAVRDAVVKAVTESPTDALEIPEKVAQGIAMTGGNHWRDHAERLALILLRAYTPEDP